MVLNNKGQVMILAVMLFVLAFIVAVVLVNPVKDMTVLARNSANLDCDNSSISTGTALACVIVDLYLPYFIIAVILAGAGLLTSRMVGGG